jgi:hypothetical protein
VKLRQPDRVAALVARLAAQLLADIRVFAHALHRIAGIG